MADVKEMLKEQLEYRELLVQMTRRDLLLRYKQTAMGFGWALFMPLVNTALFSVIFTRVAPLDTGGLPYPVYAFCGLLVWNFFASALRFSVNSLTSNVTLVTKVYFPREIFPFSAVIVSLVDFLIAMPVLAGLMAYYGIRPTWALLALPVVIAINIIFAAAVSLALAMANLFYRDVKYLFEIVITVWMFATSVVYPVERVGGRLAHVLQVNPMTAIVEAYRDILLRGVLPDAASFLAATALSLVMLAAAWVTFHRAEFRFAENI